MKTNIPNSLFIRNRANLMARLPEKSVAVFTANEPMPRNGDQFYPFRQQSDFFYLTGIDAENAFLIWSPLRGIGSLAVKTATDFSGRRAMRFALLQMKRLFGMFVFIVYSFFLFLHFQHDKDNK